jgi:hypothetical protein
MSLIAGMLLATAAAPALAASEASRAETAAALPDWSGVWAPEQPDVFDAPTGKTAPGLRDHPPYKPMFEAKYLAEIAKLKHDRTSDPLSDCQPTGVPRMMTLPGLFEFTVTPEQVFVFSDRTEGGGPASTGVQTRRIYTDGRPQLAGDDLFPTYTGNSVGHWDGNTLVVRTVGLRDDNFLDRTGALLSGQEVFTERIRMTGPNTLEDRFTIEDGASLTRPWEVRRTWRRRPGVEIVDGACGGRSVNPADLADRALAAKAGASR